VSFPGVGTFTKTCIEETRKKGMMKFRVHAVVTLRVKQFNSTKCRLTSRQITFVFMSLD